jgi:hypothetical protein
MQDSAIQLAKAIPICAQSYDELTFVQSDDELALMLQRLWLLLLVEPLLLPAATSAAAPAFPAAPCWCHVNPSEPIARAAAYSN